MGAREQLAGPTPGCTIGVVIRTLNEGDLIGRCLETLARQVSPYELDVLVVDSGSTDETLKIARTHGARIVELSPGGFDYSKALNLGIENVAGELVVSLSAHAIPVDDRWLERMTAPFSDPVVAGVYSRQVPWPDAPWQEVHRLRDQFGKADRVHDREHVDELVFSNAASSIRRSVWQKEPFTLPAVEDLEWARRVIGAGWKIVYAPEASVYHSHHENARAQARRLIDINRVADSEARSRRRTVREAAGLLFRESRKIVSLDEPLRRKPAYLADLTRVVFYYVVDFSRAGTTAERRREDADAPTASS
jgi:GT2 family glycosyltransferase